MSYTTVNASSSRSPNDGVAASLSVTFNEGASRRETMTALDEAYERARTKLTLSFDRRDEERATKAAEKPAEARKPLTLDGLLEDILGPAEGFADSIFGSISRALEQEGNCPNCYGLFTVSQLGLCRECETWR